MAKRQTAKHDTSAKTTIIAESTSVKQDKFISTPMGDKPVTCVPGIGPVHGQKLAQNGIDKASQLYGVYLQMDKNEVGFKAKLNDEIRVNNGRDRDRCCDALSGWDKQNFK